MNTSLQVDLNLTEMLEEGYMTDLPTKPTGGEKKASYAIAKTNRRLRLKQGKI